MIGRERPAELNPGTDVLDRRLQQTEREPTTKSTNPLETKLSELALLVKGLRAHEVLQSLVSSRPASNGKPVEKAAPESPKPTAWPSDMSRAAVAGSR